METNHTNNGNEMNPFSSASRTSRKIAAIDAKLDDMTRIWPTLNAKQMADTRLYIDELFTRRESLLMGHADA